MYRARDGWVFVGGLRHEIDKLRRVPGLEHAPDEGTEKFLEAKIAQREVAHWVKLFNDAGLAGHRIDSLEDIRSRYLHEVSEGNLDAWTTGGPLPLFALWITRSAVRSISRRLLMCV